MAFVFEEQQNALAPTPTRPQPRFVFEEEPKPPSLLERATSLIPPVPDPSRPDSGFSKVARDLSTIPDRLRALGQTVKENVVEPVNAALLNPPDILAPIKAADVAVQERFPEASRVATRALRSLLPDPVGTIRQSMAAFPEERQRMQELATPVFGRAGEPIGTALAAASAAAPLFPIAGVPFAMVPPAVSQPVGQLTEQAKAGIEAGAGAVGAPEPIARFAGEIGSQAAFLGVLGGVHAALNRGRAQPIPQWQAQDFIAKARDTSQPLPPLSAAEAEAVANIARASSDAHLRAGVARMADNDPRYGIYLDEINRRQGQAPTAPTAPTAELTPQPARRLQPPEAALPPEPAFVETARTDLPGARVPEAPRFVFEEPSPGIVSRETTQVAPEPPRLTADQVVEKIAEASEGQKTFDAGKIARQVKKAGETFVKTEVRPEELTTRPMTETKAGKAAPEKGAIVIDESGKVIDGNHRATQAKLEGEPSIPAYAPETPAERLAKLEQPASIIAPERTITEPPRVGPQPGRETQPEPKPQIEAGKIEGAKEVKPEPELQKLIDKWRGYQQAGKLAGPRNPNTAYQYYEMGQKLEREIAAQFGSDAATKMIKDWKEEQAKPKTGREILKEAKRKRAEEKEQPKSEPTKETDQVRAGAEAQAGRTEEVARPVRPHETTGTYDRAKAQETYRQFKTRLTRALNKKDWPQVIEEARQFKEYYEKPDSPPYPDDWSRWERAADDAQLQLRRQENPPWGATLSEGAAAAKAKAREKKEEGGEAPETAGSRTVGQILRDETGAIFIGRGKPTSIKNKTVTEELRELDLPAPKHGQRLSFEEARRAAESAFAADPHIGQRLVDELSAKPRPATALEDAILLREQTRIKNERIAAEDAVIAAQKSGNADQLSEAKRRVEQANGDFARIGDVVTQVGTESSLSLGHRRMMMKQDYSLAAMERAVQVANDGKALTDKQREEIKVLHDKINVTEKAFEEYMKRAEEEKAELESKLAHERLKEEKPESEEEVEPEVESLTDRLIRILDAQAKAARARVKEKMARLSAGLDPTLVSDLAIIGAAKLAHGTRNFAKWSKAMVDDLGQKIQPHLKEIWEASTKKLDEFVTKRVAKPKRAPVERVMRGKSPEAKRETIRERLGAAEEGEDIGFLAHRLARSFVEEGITDRNELINAVHEELRQFIPEITRRETMDAISGYGSFKELTKDPVSVELRDLKGQMQQIAKLEDIANQIPPKKSGIERRTPSDEERRLIQQVEEAKRRSGIVATDPEHQLQTALGAIKTRLRNAISDLNHQIATGKKIHREKVEIPLDVEAKDLKARRDELKHEFDQIFGRHELTDEGRLQIYKTQLQKRITALEERVAARDLEPKPRKVIPFDKEARRLQFKAEEARREFNHLVLEQKLRNRSLPRKVFGTVGEAMQTSRAVLTSLDLSAVLRQGGIIGLGHPLRAANAMPDMFRALASRQKEHQIMQEIRERDSYPLMKRSKLYIAEPGTSLAQMEEAYMSRWAERIPLVAASQRAYTTYLNRLRADSFDAMTKTLGRNGEVSEEEAQAIANYINVVTGRGHLGMREDALVGLNSVFFAPRYAASRFQVLAGQPFYKGNARTRTLIAKEYALYLAGLGLVYGLGQLAGADVETDPRSSDFGKIRFGNTRVDPLSGLAQATVLLSRLAMGETKQLSGRVVPIRGNVPYGGADAADVMARFLRTKLAPVPGAAVNIAVGKNVVGEEVTAESLARDVFVPLSMRDIYEAMVDQGIPKGTALATLSIFGAGLQSFEQKRPLTRTERKQPIKPLPPKREVKTGTY